MAGALVCSGMLGLTGVNGAASPPGWSAFAPNLSNRRSIGVEAGLAANGATDLNNQSIRNLVGGAYVPSGSAINMGAFYNGAPTYAWSSFPNPIGEGPSYSYTVITTKIANGAILNWSLSGPGGAAGQVSPTSGSMSVFNNSASFSFTTVADQTTDGAKLLNISVTRPSDGVAVLAGSVTVNDTSVTKSASITSPTNGSSINEGTIHTVTVNNAGFNNGDTLYWTASGAITAFSGSFTTNGSVGSFNITTTGGAFPNVLVGTYCGVEARQAGNQSLTLQIRRDSTAGTILASATYTVTDSNLGGVNTITWTQNSTPLVGTTINTAYNSGATAGFTRSGGPYRIGLANNIQITIPAGQYVLNGLTINGTGNAQDRYFITVNGGLIGRGGSAVAQAGSPGLTLQSLAGTVTLGGSGVIAGGGGAGGGYGRCSQPIGGKGAGTVLSQPQAVGATGSTICRGAREGGGGGNYWSGGSAGIGAWQPGGSTIGFGGGGAGGGGGAIWYDPAFTGTGAGNWKGGNGGTSGMGTNASFSNAVALGAGAAGGGGGGLGFAGASGVLRNSSSANHAGGSAGSSISPGGSPISGSVAVERGPRI